MPPSVSIYHSSQHVDPACGYAGVRQWLASVADERAALQRVASLVARRSSSCELFAAIAEEAGSLFGLAQVRIARFACDGAAIAVAECHGRAQQDLGHIIETVRRTGRPVRIDDHVVATPIAIHGALWGAMAGAAERPVELPAGTEARMREFAELIASAISHIQVRADLAASRARIVAAGHSERRRVVRDLHDGAQQRLVSTVITLKLAGRALARDDRDAARELVGTALDHAQQASVELRELAHGVLPAALIRGGIGAGVEELAARMPVPVELDVVVGRLPSDLEVTAYFAIAESLTNVAKHARAGRAAVAARVAKETLSFEVRDDGVGGARSDGPGFVGVADRLAVVGGRLQVTSPPGGGTLVAAQVPLAGSRCDER